MIVIRLWPCRRLLWCQKYIGNKVCFVLFNLRVALVISDYLVVMFTRHIDFPIPISTNQAILLTDHTCLMALFFVSFKEIILFIKGLFIGKSMFSMILPNSSTSMVEVYSPIPFSIFENAKHKI